MIPGCSIDSKILKIRYFIAKSVNKTASDADPRITRRMFSIGSYIELSTSIAYLLSFIEVFLDKYVILVSAVILPALW